MASLLEQQATEPQEDVGQSTRKQFEASNMFMSDAGAAELFKDFGTYVDRGVEGVERAITEIGDFFKENIKPTDFVPGAGTVDASKAAGDRFAKGDYLGAGMGVVEGVASTALDAVGSAGGAAGMAGVGMLKGGARAAQAGAMKLYGGIKNALKAEDFFSPKAIEDVISESKAWKGRSTLVYMSPDEFLSIAKKRNGNMDSDKIATVKKYAGEWNTTPSLKIEGDITSGTTAFGHEGRNRADYLKANGVDSMPVEIRHDVYRWGDEGANQPDLPSSIKIKSEDTDDAIEVGIQDWRGNRVKPQEGLLAKQEVTHTTAKLDPAKRKSQNVMAGTAGAAVVGGGMLAKPDSAEASTAASVPKAPTKDFSALWGRLYQGKSDPAKIKDFQQDVKRLYGKAPKEEVLVDMSNKAAVAFAADVDMDPSEFSELMYVTALHESSGGRHKVQGGGGPARGYWQVEPETAVDLVKNSLALFGPQFTKATGLSKKDLQGLGIHQFKRILMDPKVTAMFAAAKYVAAIQNDRK